MSEQTRTAINHQGGDAVIDAHEDRERHFAALTAMYDWLQFHEGEVVSALYEHYFPPSTLPFTKADLRHAFMQEWHAGRIDLTVDRRVVYGTDGSRT